MPNWFPWIFIGGIIFIIFGFIGSKYKDKEYNKVKSIQDFISGSILIAFTGVLVPDLFPKMDLSNILPKSLDAMDSGDLDLQVGPPRLIGK